MTSAELAIPLQGVTGSGDVRSKCIFLPQNKKSREHPRLAGHRIWRPHKTSFYFIADLSSARNHQPSLKRRLESWSRERNDFVWEVKRLEMENGHAITIKWEPGEMSKLTGNLLLAFFTLINWLGKRWLLLRSGSVDGKTKSKICRKLRWANVVKVRIL